MAIDPSIPVLVVDDNATTIGIIRKLLLQLGFVNVDDACECAAALARMRVAAHKSTPMTHLSH
jgi:two-component system, chemotaxis family, chemotaxis protein CheY